MLQYFFSLAFGLLLSGNFLYSEQAAAEQTEQPSRSLAAIQEKEFDHKLNRFNRCYGVQLSYEHASEGRRRSCKALVVHRIGSALEEQGAYFSSPLRFECQNTAAGQTEKTEWQTEPVFRLKPNLEYEVLDKAIQNYLVKVEANQDWQRAVATCEFYLECRNDLSWSNLTFRTIRRCLMGADSNLVSRLLQREILDTIFRRASTGLVIPTILQEAAYERQPASDISTENR